MSLTGFIFSDEMVDVKDAASRYDDVEAEGAMSSSSCRTGLVVAMEDGLEEEFSDLGNYDMLENEGKLITIVLYILCEK